MRTTTPRWFDHTLFSFTNLPIVTQLARDILLPGTELGLAA
jgi:hypothetical protein